MCDCGCNTCETKKPALMLNESLAPRAILSEGLNHHLNANKPLTDHLYRAGSTAYFNLWAEARSYYSRGIIDITNEDDLAVLTETNLGHFGMFEGKKVPLDFPMLNESYDYDEVAQSEFGMDYDQLGSGEKEWVRDEIDNMSMNESDSNYPDFDLNKNIRYQDTSISSGMWRYTGKEQGGKGVYRNLNNGQILAFDRSDFDIFRNNLSSHFDISESLNEAIYTDPNTGKSYDLQHDSSKNRWELDIIKKDSSIYDKIVTIKRKTVEEIIDWLEGYNIDSSWVKKSLNETNKISDDKLVRLMPKIPKGYGGKNTGIGEYTISTPDGEDIVLTQSKDKKNWFYEPSNVALKILNEDIYDKFLDNPHSPKGRAKSLILKFTKEYGDDASSMAVDRFASKNNLKPEEKYILKYITKNDIKISSQSGGPDFSTLNEADDKLLKIKQELEALRPGTISWIDDIFISSYDGSLQVELDYTLYPDEIKQLAQIAAKYGMELKYMTGKNATLVKSRINEAIKKVLTENKSKKKEKKDPPLNKPTRDSSGGKAYKVYVKDPKTGNIKTVRFGSGGLRAKINDKKARNAFAARHKCSTKKDKTKAGYWSCRLPRYAKLLGLKSNFSGFW